MVTLRESPYPNAAYSSGKDFDSQGATAPSPTSNTHRSINEQGALVRSELSSGKVRQSPVEYLDGPRIVRANAAGQGGALDRKGIPPHIFHYSGNTSWATLHHKMAPAFQTAWPDFQLRYTHPVGEALGSTTDIKMLLQGQLAFSQSSRPIKPEEYEKARQRGYDLKQIPVAIDGVAIAVHPNLDIPGLTLTDLKGIYTGLITNWSQVNGPDLPIVPYSRPVEVGGSTHFFVEKVLENGQLGHNVKLVDDTPMGLQKVAANPGGIYYANAPSMVTQCSTKVLPIAHAPESDFISPYGTPLVPFEACPTQRNQLNVEAFKNGDYPITRQLFVIVKQDGGLDQQAGEAYAELLLTEEGQRLIQEAGFVSIR